MADETNPTNAALAQTPAPSLGLAPKLGSPTRSEPASRLIEQTDAALASLPLATTPETRGGPYGRVSCSKCDQEFLTSRPNLKCPRCGGSPTGASLERAFGTGKEAVKA